MYLKYSCGRIFSHRATTFQSDIPLMSETGFFTKGTIEQLVARVTRMVEFSHFGHFLKIIKVDHLPIWATFTYCYGYALILTKSFFQYKVKVLF
jgi:hypothetical protein